ncbi:aromatic acid exporter family protein [Cohnella sp. REN36]|uniref:FUSC family protein n=1 Tax=Cohnella sp. REN36 TaxID=2887347 RepID=UPI001D14C2B4|nr:aromatic acid exporter family protein [Cohnella sp. REN36]MCC3377262.1 aromatic acid exporter family protein [Cohnella sp. REN36]
MSPLGGMTGLSRKGESAARILKTAVAAAAAWEIAQAFGSKHPFFAPLAAVLCLQVTVEKSLRKGFQRVVGICIGVLLASVFTREIGIGGWSIGLLILIGLMIGRLFRLPEYAYTQIGVSALLVLTVGEDATYGLDRLAETVVGAAVAVGANLAIVPPDYSRSAAASLSRAAEAFARHSRLLSRWVGAGANGDEGEHLRRSAAELNDEIRQAADRLEQSMHALKFSPFLRRRRGRLRRLRQRMQKLELGYLHAMEMQRILLERSQAGPLEEPERRRWRLFFGHFADGIERWSNLANRSETGGDKRCFASMEPDLPTLTKAIFEDALILEARQMLDDFDGADRRLERLAPETSVAFGRISDGRSRGHDLAEN